MTLQKPDAEVLRERLTEDHVLAVYRALGVEKCRPCGANYWKAVSPLRPDSSHNPSFNFHRRTGYWEDKATGDKGDVFSAVMRRRNCSFPEAIEIVADIIGARPAPQKARSVSAARAAHGETTPVAEYKYHDARGHLLYVVERRPGKRFLMKRPDGNHGWNYGLEGVPKVPYRLPDFPGGPGTWLIHVEGEKDADRASHHGLAATTSAGGSSGWQDELKVYYAGLNVAVIPDNDEPGMRYALQVAASLQGVARQVKLVELPGLGPRRDNGGRDLSDWLDAGHTITDLMALIEATPDWEVPPREDDGTPYRSSVELQKLSDVPAEPVQWIWTNWIAAGKFHVVGAPAGVGKSYLMSDLGSRLTTGKSWPDGTPNGVSRKVLWLIGEDGISDTLKPRIIAHDGDDSRMAVLTRIRVGDKSEPFAFAKHLSHLRDVIRDEAYDVVIVDPVSSYLTGSDRNSEKIRDVLGPLRDLADETGAAIIAVHHTGKPGTNEQSPRAPLDRLLGSTAIGAIPRIVHMVAPASVDETDRARVVSVVKSNIGRIPRSLSWRLPEHGEDDMPGPIIWTGESSVSVADLLKRSSGPRLTPEREAILEFLRRHGPSRTGDIAESLGRSVSSASNLLTKMSNDGLIEKLSYGVYTLPGTGGKCDECSVSDVTRSPGKLSSFTSNSSLPLVRVVPSDFVCADNRVRQDLRQPDCGSWGQPCATNRHR